jgi:MFS superfamily sulfate permease-like transporter
MQDWLFLAYHRVRGVEYGLLVATFVAIMVMGLELGIAAGIVAASLLFAYNYSKVCSTKCAQLAVGHDTVRDLAGISLMHIGWPLVC